SLIRVASMKLMHVSINEVEAQREALALVLGLQVPLQCGIRKMETEGDPTLLGTLYKQRLKRNTR
ncbi:hypothetical protein KI387_009877, partial [Taxus chinensis]